MNVLFEPEGWKARRSMELVFTLGRCLDDIKGGTFRLWKEDMRMEAPWVTYPSPLFFTWIVICVQHRSHEISIPWRTYGSASTEMIA